MTSPILNIDLHCHSTVSDGALAPRSGGAGACQRRGCLGPDRSRRDRRTGRSRRGRRELGMRFATGVEISVTWAGLTVHVVGLRFDPSTWRWPRSAQDPRRPRRARQAHRRAAGWHGHARRATRRAFAGNPELISRTHFARATWSRPAIARMCRPSSASTWATMRRPRADAMGTLPGRGLDTRRRRCAVIAHRAATSTRRCSSPRCSMSSSSWAARASK